MSNIIRKLQRRKSKKRRTGRTTRSAKPGPARTSKMQPEARVESAPTDADGKPLPMDFTKADPSCKSCHGTGVCGVAIETRGKEKHATKLACPCVRRGMAGGAPWLKNEELKP